MQSDWVVGQVTEALPQSGFADNTLVIFTSDNGPEVDDEIGIGAFERVRKYGHSSMGSLRGVKRDAWEGGHRVPLIARWPGHAPAGKISDQFLILTDVMATCAAITGSVLSNNAAEDSVNMLPALLGGEVAREAGVMVGISGKAALRQGDWVLIVAATGRENPALTIIPALLLTPLAALHSAASPAKPNIVYILADDLGYGDVQCLNPQRGKIKTPHLDQLAAQGMTFTDAHSGSSVCTPTRYGLLTGRYAWRTRLQSGVLDGTDDPPLISAGRLTVPAFLQHQGYATAALGKWHLGFGAELPAGSNAPDKKALKKTNGGRRVAGGLGLPVGSRIIDGPVTRGFDYFWGCSNARAMSGLIENDRVIENIKPIDMLPRLGQRAVAYVAEHAAEVKAGKPFFLYLALTSPHTPIVPTPVWQGQSGLGNYGDFVMQTDAVVGDVLAALEQHGLSSNTLVVFTSDNGCSPAAGTAKLEQLGHFASARFRGYKSDIWDGGHRAPFFARWPGKVKAASYSSQLICHTDLMATCADLLGVKLPDTAAGDSVSMLPALLDAAQTPLREAVVHHSIHGMFAIRQGQWKLELCPGSGGWGQPGDGEAPKQGLPGVQLYDLDADISEKINVQAGNPEVVTRLTKLLERYIADGRSTPGAKQANDVALTLGKAGAKPRQQKPAAKESATPAKP